MNQTETNLQRIRAYNQRVCDEWDESKHPRAANGQFGSGGGGSKKSKSSSNEGSNSKKSNSSTPSIGSAQTGTIKKESAWKSYHQDKHPDITEVMKLIGQLNKE